MMTLLLYWSGREGTDKFDLLAPFFYQSITTEEDIRVLLPFHFQYQSKDLQLKLFGPYFSKSTIQERTRFLFPLYYDSTSPDTKLTFFALYFRQRTSELDSDILFPLYWSVRPRSIERKSYETLIPFYLKVALKKDRSRTILSPLFWWYKDPVVSQGFFPPYYWNYTEMNKTGVGFPLYWRFFKKEDGREKDIHIAVPWFKYSTNRFQIKSFVPIYWSGATSMFDQEPSTVSVGQNQWHLFLPLLYSSKKADGTTKILTPLFSRFHDRDGKEYGHSGLNFFVRDVWGGKSEGIFPFFHYREEPDFFRLRFLTFYLERYQNNEQLRTSLFPLFRYRRTADRKQFLTFLFYRDKDPDISRGFFIPYYWSTERNPDDPNHPVVSQKRILFPLVWHYQSEDQKTTIGLPLFASYVRQNYNLKLLLPLYFDRTKGQDRFIIIPPFMARYSPEKKWIGLFFVFWKSEKGNQTSQTLFPIYRRSKFADGFSFLLPGYYYLKRGDETQGFVGPYLWDYRGKTQYDILLPLYWRFKRPTWTIKTFFPIYTIETEQIKEQGFFPIWAKTVPSPKKFNEGTVPSIENLLRDGTAPSHKTVESLDKERDVSSSTATPKHFLADSHRVLPFYFYRKLDSGSDLILPILLGRIEKGLDSNKEKIVKGRILLLNYWEKSSNHFMNRFDPIYSYYNRPEKKGFSAPTAPFPLWQYETEFPEDEKGKIIKGAFFPYYWKRTRILERDMVFPIFYHRREMSPSDQKELFRVTWLINYYASQNAETTKKKRLFVPLYWHFQDKYESRTIVPPVWMERGKNFRRDIVFPLWWNFIRDKEKLFVLFPFFLKSSDDTTQSRMLFFPGYWQKEDPDSSIRLAGLFLQREDFLKQKKTTVVFPIFWQSQEPERTSRSIFPIYWELKSKTRLMTYFFPLYFQHKKENLDWKIAFPLFWRFHTKDTDIKVVPPYFSIYSQNSQIKTDGFAPIWSYSRNVQGNWKSFQILGGLFGYERRDLQKKLIFLYFFKL